MQPSGNTNLRSRLVFPAAMLVALKAKGKKKILSDMMDEQIEAAQELMALTHVVESALPKIDEVTKVLEERAEILRRWKDAKNIVGIETLEKRLKILERRKKDTINKLRPNNVEGGDIDVIEIEKLKKDIDKLKPNNVEGGVGDIDVVEICRSL